MTTVTVKRIGNLFDQIRTAGDGIRVYVDGANIIGDDADYFSSFRDSEYESSDATAVMLLLKALDRHSVLKLECDEDVERVYLCPK